MSPRVWVGLAVSAASIVFLFATVDFAELGQALSGANLLLVAACVATLPVTMYLKSYR